jgi:hypothetical protein
VSVSLVALGDNPRDITVVVSWGAAAANGSPVTGYTVTLTASKNGNQSDTWTGTVGGLGANRTLACLGAYCPNTRVDATVIATNGVGSGAAGTGTYTFIPNYSVPREHTDHIQAPSTDPPDHSEAGMQAVLAAGLYCSFDPAEISSVNSCGPPDCVVWRVVTRARCVR